MTSSPHDAKQPRRAWPAPLRPWADDSGWCPLGTITIDRANGGVLTHPSWLGTTRTVGYYKEAYAHCSSTQRTRFFRRNYYFAGSPDARTNSVFWEYEVDVRDRTTAQ